MPRSVAAFDLGTGGIKGGIFDAGGICLAEHVVPYQTLFPAPSRHEQRPQDWWQAFLDCLRALLARPEVDALQIAAIALSGHSLGCIPLDEDGALLQDAVPIWSDGRAAAQADAFFTRFDRVDWYQMTGNGFPAPLYTLFKIMWLRDEAPEVFARIRTVIGTKDYLNLRLTGRIATDVSYASGSGCFDLRAGRYSDEILAAAGIDPTLLPPVIASTEAVGALRAEIRDEFGLASDVKVVAGGVDNSCMALGAATFAEGDIFSSMGSSSWLTVSSARPLLDDDVHSYAFAHVVPGQFISATSIFSSGTSMGWIRDRLMPDIGEEAAASGRNAYEAMIERGLTSPPGARGLLFVPTLAGGTALEGGPSVRGAFVGLDLQHERADIIRAGLEGIALGLRVALDELRRMTAVSDEIIAVGGGAQSTAWRQIFADIFDCTILKTGVDQEAAALGAAALALVGIGLWKDFETVRALHVPEGRSRPRPRNRAVYDAALTAYRQAAEQQKQLAGGLEALRAISD
ncbi:MAG: FGGY-family carbohydrate kinase [Bauldia sp.]|uniref:xylulokinase n=1 Tax=Bauldia sp. TaxID=2575872 RepID=UPI001D2EAE1D|nr:FGGY-family carbohydrate kinase [Bauldia sp.]MCB1497363.1 FGGY-family carbohydrate kinase [Bauldia sp.]